MSDERHEGFANYETWTVSLWIGNDRKLMQQAHAALAAGYRKGEETAQEYGWTKDERDKLGRSYAADAVKEWVEDKLPNHSDLASGLFRCAIVRVDWLEIASEWLEEREA